MTKDALRQVMKARRAGLDPAGAARDSALAQDRLCALPAFRAARRIGLYLAKRGEVATDRILAAARADGRELAVPARRGAAWDYGFCRLRPAAALKAGPLGIAEPAEPEWLDAAGLDFIVVPGVAFDARGRRLGHGLGCYDRMLADAGRAFLAGLCFEWQIAPEVPADERDVAMHAVVTDQHVYGNGTGSGAGARPVPVG